MDAFAQSPDPLEWLKATRASVQDDVALLYKRTGKDYETQYGIRYVPDTTVEAPDWNPDPECGGGLHFCADPAGGDLFRSGEDGRYVACEVKVAEIVVHAQPAYPDKIKAPRCKVLYECNREGKPIGKVQGKP